VTKPVFIIPSIQSYPYSQDFESESGWVVEGVNSSWELGQPAGSVINSAYNGQNAWVTRLAGEYNASEKSYINTPSFDLTSLQRPMLSMAIWTHTQVGFDGAIIQFSLDGGEEWQNLGNVDEGIGLNWYTEKGLIGRPGEDANEGSNGWSGVQDGWKVARYPLDEIKDQTAVRFRIAFGSDATNPPESDFNGFAFDAFWIGEREKLVMVEHFTNLFSLSSNNSNQTVNNVLQARPNDAISLQYHISSPRPDPIFIDNINPSNTRGSIYNLTQSPRTVLDGLTFYNYQPNALNQRDLLNRSLAEPMFDLELELIEESATSLATVRVTLRARANFDEEVVVHLVPVEKTVIDYFLQAGNLRNVVKDMVPDPGGNIFVKNWIAGDFETFEETWSLNGLNLYDSTTLAMVAFVQNTRNETTREIYQSAVIDLPIKYPDRVTSLPDMIYSDAFKDVRLYPNPVKDIFNVQFSEILHKDLDWQIVDMKGVATHKGRINAGFDRYEFSTDQLSEGVHNIIFSNGQDILLVKKMVVIKDW
ncbi:MAG: T9SS type A sorting domain-containing protein, partial [Cyclobacteriaceae bacterium]